MIDAAGNPKTLEFNCRLGDPETQPILMRLKSDLLDLIEPALTGSLDRVAAEWDRRCALGVVLAAAGYPDEPRRGDCIEGLPTAAEPTLMARSSRSPQPERLRRFTASALSLLAPTARTPRPDWCWLRMGISTGQR